MSCGCFRLCQFLVFILIHSTLLIRKDGTTDNDSSSPVSALRFSNEGWDDLPVQMVVVSAGIKPRDDLAQGTDIAVGERGGIVVDEHFKTR